jgi:hypothetical protein
MNWISDNPAVPLKAPLQSTVLDRSAVRLAFVVAQFQLETALRWKKRDVDGRPGDETFCNFAAVAMTTALGAPLPQLRANEIALWLEGQSLDPHSGWEQIDEHTAQRMADEGQVAVAVWQNPQAGKPGHIAVLVPSLDEPGTWIAQAGAVNFTRGKLEKGFGPFKPLFYGHP